MIGTRIIIRMFLRDHASYKPEMIMKLNYRSWLCALLFFALVGTQLPQTLAPTNEVSPYAALNKGKVVHGFRTDAVYLDATDKPFGGHFIHLRTGFTLDLLQIQSVPQAVI